MNTKNYYAFLNTMEQSSDIPNLFLFSINIPQHIEQKTNEQFDIILKSSRTEFITKNEIINDLIFRPNENPIFYNKNTTSGLRKKNLSEPIILTFSSYRLLSEKDDPQPVGCTCFVPQKLEEPHFFLNIPQEISQILKKTIGEENFSLEGQTQISLDQASDWQKNDAVYDFVSNYENLSQFNKKLSSIITQTQNKKNIWKI